MTDYKYSAIQLDQRGGTLTPTLPEAVEEVEDHLRTGVICEIVEASEWRDKPVRLWFNRQWYEVRDLVAPEMLAAAKAAYEAHEATLKALLSDKNIALGAAEYAGFMTLVASAAAVYIALLEPPATE